MSSPGVPAPAFGDAVSAAAASPPGRPVVVGPITPDRRAIPGGSALNVTLSLRTLGFDPLLVTRVGNDSPGKRLLEILHASRSDITGVQIDRANPTWDHIGRPDVATARADNGLASETAITRIREVIPSLVFQTTTAVRSEHALQMLNDIQWGTGVPFFVDLDLDETWLTAHDLRRGLLGAKWLRIRSTDLPALIRTSGTWTGKQPEILTAAQSVQSTFALETVVVDHLGLPTLIVSGDQVAHSDIDIGLPGDHHARRKDLTAAELVAGIISGLPARQLLKRAVNRALQLIGQPVDG